MTAVLLTGWLIAAAPVPAPPGMVPILAGTAAYRSLPGIEMVIAGTLGRADGASYQLTPVDARPLRLHAPGKAHLLEAHLGRRVRLRGKWLPAADGAILWVGAMERLDLPDRVRGVLARCYLAAPGPAVAGIDRRVVRSGEALAPLLQVTGPTAAATATRLLAGRLGVGGIDWRTQMVVSVTHPLTPRYDRLQVVRLTRRDGTLVVHYRLSGGPGVGFARPGETVLLPRHDGPIEVAIEGADTPRQPRRF